MAVTLSSDDHGRVTAAVASAERGTDGEIVTILTRRSDGYTDVALYYAVVAMITAGVLFIALPGVIEARLAWFEGGWRSEASDPRLVLILSLVGEIMVFALAWLAMQHPGLRMALVPGIVRSRRVRERAVQFFKASAEQRTADRVGVLLYLSIDEHRAEIVADDAILARVQPDEWGAAMAALIDHVRDDKVSEGMAVAIGMIGELLSVHFPKSDGNPNELPDRLIEL